MFNCSIYSYKYVSYVFSFLQVNFMSRPSGRKKAHTDDAKTEYIPLQTPSFFSDFAYGPQVSIPGRRDRRRFNKRRWMSRKGMERELDEPTTADDRKERVGGSCHLIAMVNEIQLQLLRDKLHTSKLPPLKQQIHQLLSETAPFLLLRPKQIETAGDMWLD